MTQSAIVRHDFAGYFEDFAVGDVYQHPRGKTVSELDNVLITNMVLNTAEPHFNEHFAQSDPMLLGVHILAADTSGKMTSA